MLHNEIAEISKAKLNDPMPTNVRYYSQTIIVSPPRICDGDVSERENIGTIKINSRRQTEIYLCSLAQESRKHVKRSRNCDQFLVSLFPYLRPLSIDKEKNWRGRNGQQYLTMRLRIFRSNENRNHFDHFARVD